MEIMGLTTLYEAFKREREKLLGVSASDGEKKVVVGYTAAYSIHVHENLEMKWRGQPRDPRLRETKSGRHVIPPRPRQYNPKGLFWDPQGVGQSKFLEGPAREYSRELADLVRDTMAQGKTLLQALTLAGLLLLRESQKIVPVDTGNLKNSGFVRVE